jgi:hypothetical protein
MEDPLDFTFSLHLSPWLAASLLSLLVRLLAARLRRFGVCRTDNHLAPPEA